MIDGRSQDVSYCMQMRFVISLIVQMKLSPAVCRIHQVTDSQFGRTFDLRLLGTDALTKRMNKRCAMFVEIPSAVARLSLVHILSQRCLVAPSITLVHRGDGDARLRMVFQSSLHSAIKL
jgi:hypothetical protein